jgi:hypothetical protein
MTIRELYRFAIERGLTLDPRGEEALRAQMEEARQEYEGLSGKAKALFDRERLENPFGDTRMLVGDPDTPIRRILCGIDIDGTEVLLADRLRDCGKPVDAVAAHHASAPGGGVGSRRDILSAQIRMLTDFGVPEHLAVKLIRQGFGEGEERSHNFKINQIAQALGMPFMTIHGPADLYLFREGERILREERPPTVGDLVDICDAWPEVQWLMERGTGTQVAVGDPRDPLGRTYYCFYGGWNPTPEVFEALCEAGCGTLWVVATSEALNEVARRRNVSIVVVPHYPADNYGLNRLFDDAMTRFGDFDVVESSNFVRHDRRAA